MKKLLLALFLPLLISLPANALIELRAGYGLITPSDDFGSGAELASFAGFNADAIFELPMFPLGLGLRYESMGSALQASGQADVDAEFTRTSLLVNYRIIDLFLYFGPIATIGFQNDAKFTNFPVIGNIEMSTDLTYTVGVEAGVSLGLFMVGAELGYFLGGDFDIDSPAGATFTGGTYNMDGLYAKAIVGVGF